MKTMTDRIYRFIFENPGKTNNEIAAALGIEPQRVAALTGQMSKRTPAGKSPRVIRRPTAETANKIQPVYTHFVADEKQAEKDLNESEAETKVALETVKAKSGTSIESLIDEIAKKIANNITASIGKHLVSQLRAVLPESQDQQFDLVQYLKNAIVPAEMAQAVTTGQVVPPSVEKKRTRLPKIVVCGLLPQQAGMINSEFGGVYDLSFWKEEGIDKLKSLCRNSDHVITFSGKLPHHVENTVKSVGAQFSRVMGGMTELRRVLNGLNEVAK